MPAHPPAPVPPAPPFIGRTAEGRAVLLSVRAARSVALVAPPAYGKSALLRELTGALEEVTVRLEVPKLAPFSQFLTDLHDALHAAKIHPPGVQITHRLADDRALWKKTYPGGTEARARSLIEALRLYGQQGTQPPAVVVDDAGGVTQGMVPVLVALDALSPADSRALVGSLTAAYGIVTPDVRAYENAVLNLSAGVPGEIVRLVRYVPAGEIVQKKGGSMLAQNAAAREERGVALAPLLLVAGAGFMVTKYVGLARGEMDGYVIGGVGIAVFMVLGPVFRKWTVTK